MSTVCKHRVFILQILQANLSFQQTDIGLLLCPREQLQGTCYWLYPKAFSFDCPYFENAFGWPESSCFMNFVWSNSFHRFDFKLKRPTLPPFNSNSHSSRRDPKVSYRGHYHCPRRTQANGWESKLLRLFVRHDNNLLSGVCYKILQHSTNNFLACGWLFTCMKLIYVAVWYL